MFWEILATKRLNAAATGCWGSDFSSWISLRRRLTQVLGKSFFFKESLNIDWRPRPSNLPKSLNDLSAFAEDTEKDNAALATFSKARGRTSSVFKLTMFLKYKLVFWSAATSLSKLNDYGQIATCLLRFLTFSQVCSCDFVLDIGLTFIRRGGRRGVFCFGMPCVAKCERLSSQAKGKIASLKLDADGTAVAHSLSARLRVRSIKT